MEGKDRWKETPARGTRGHRTPLMEKKDRSKGTPARGTQPSGRTGHRGKGIPATEVPDTEHHGQKRK